MPLLLLQRLHQAGWSHARVSLTTIAATAVLAVAMLAEGWPGDFQERCHSWAAFQAACINGS